MSVLAALLSSATASSVARVFRPTVEHTPPPRFRGFTGYFVGLCGPCGAPVRPGVRVCPECGR